MSGVTGDLLGHLMYLFGQAVDLACALLAAGDGAIGLLGGMTDLLDPGDHGLQGGGDLAQLASLSLFGRRQLGHQLVEAGGYLADLIAGRQMQGLWGAALLQTQEGVAQAQQGGDHHPALEAEAEQGKGHQDGGEAGNGIRQLAQPLRLGCVQSVGQLTDTLLYGGHLLLQLQAQALVASQLLAGGRELLGIAIQQAGKLGLGLGTGVLGLGRFFAQRRKFILALHCHTEQG